MSLCLRVSCLLTLIVISTGTTSAATQKEVTEAVKKGANALRALNYKDLGVGQTALAGLAMLESEEVSISDPALKNVTELVRTASYTQYKTYEVSLCLMFLDRLGDPADDILIQILGVRLLMGQTKAGGWSYNCTVGTQPGDVDWFRALKPVNQTDPPKLHPGVQTYYQNLIKAKSSDSTPAAMQKDERDDNSNTQFAVIAVWMSRKHGVPVDDALRAIENRFLETQGGNGIWAYERGMHITASPSMYCAGLIGLSTAKARRQERRDKAQAAKQPAAPPKPNPAPGAPPPSTPDDPFFTPPPPPNAKIENKKPSSDYAPDQLDTVIGNGLAGLGQAVAAASRAGGGPLILESVNRQHGVNDLYFFWSLERVCVIYGIEKLAGLDWWELGAETLVRKQSPQGIWTVGGTYGPEVHTSFAVLFLMRSNLARDLSGKVQNKIGTAMTTRKDGRTTTDNGPKLPTPGGSGTQPLPPIPLPNAAVGEAATLAYKLIKSGSDKEWTTQLTSLRDAKGGNCTDALVRAASSNSVDGDRLKQTRQALADRLTRMTAETLRAMAKSDEPELRRGAILAMGQKDDKSFIPELVNALLDDEEIVVRATKASLKSLTDQDFGPANNSNIGEKKLAKDAWQSWMEKQKK